MVDARVALYPRLLKLSGRLDLLLSQVRWVSGLMYMYPGRAHRVLSEVR